jgi:hypothetical protein
VLNLKAFNFLSSSLRGLSVPGMIAEFYIKPFKSQNSFHNTLMLKVVYMCRRPEKLNLKAAVI